MDVNSLFSFQQSREGLLMPCFTSSRAINVYKRAVLASENKLIEHCKLDSQVKRIMPMIFVKNPLKAHVSALNGFSVRRQTVFTFLVSLFNR